MRFRIHSINSHQFSNLMQRNVSRDTFLISCCFIVQIYGLWLKNWKRNWREHLLECLELQLFTNFIKHICLIKFVEITLNADLYGNIPPISNLIQERCVLLDGHWYTSEEEIVSKVLLWKPKHRKQTWVYLIKRMCIS